MALSVDTSGDFVLSTVEADVVAAVSDPRARYALGVLAGLLGLEVRDARPGEHADVGHGAVDAQVCIPQAPGDWDAPAPNIFEHEGVPLVTPRGSAAGDLLFATYAMLTGPWERRDPWDDVGCPIARRGWLARRGLLREPLVHRYAQLLGDLLGRRPPKAASFVVTHDVDDNFAHLFARRESWERLKRELRAGRPSALRRAAGLAQRLARPIASDENDRFDDWRKWHLRRGGRPAYFAASFGLFRRGADLRDVAYDVRNPAVSETLRAAARAGAEIGVHFSIGARDSAQRLREEREELEEALGVPVRSARHHWWAIGPGGETWPLHAEAGVVVDCSLGFNDDIGYRRGIAAPFRPYNPRLQRATDLWLLPTLAMDAAALALDDPREELADLLQRTASVGGAFVLDWHVHSANPRALPGAIELLDALADEAAESRLSPATPLELINA